MASKEAGKVDRLGFCFVVFVAVPCSAVIALQGASFIIDFHNFGYSLLALKTCWQVAGAILVVLEVLGVALEPGWESNIRWCRFSSWLFSVRTVCKDRGDRGDL